jgi:hypothetical protein
VIDNNKQYIGSFFHTYIVVELVVHKRSRARARARKSEKVNPIHPPGERNINPVRAAQPA